MQIGRANVSDEFCVSFDFELLSGLEIPFNMILDRDVSSLDVRFHSRARPDDEMSTRLDLATERSVYLQVLLKLKAAAEVNIVAQNCINLLHTLWKVATAPGSRKNAKGGARYYRKSK